MPPTITAQRTRILLPKASNCRATWYANSRVGTNTSPNNVLGLFKSAANRLNKDNINGWLNTNHVESFRDIS